MGSFAVNNFGDTRSGGLAGPMGLFVIVLLCIATVLLIRNMNKRLRRLPDSFSPAEQTQREADSTQLDREADRVAEVGSVPGVGHVRSSGPATGAEGEVNAVNADRDQSLTDGNQS